MTEDVSVDSSDAIWRLLPVTPANSIPSYSLPPAGAQDRRTAARRSEHISGLDLDGHAAFPLPATSTTAREICCRTGPCRRSTQRHTTGQLTPEKVGGCCKGDSNPGPTHCQSAVPQDPMTPAELQTSLVRRTIRHMATYAYRCAEHGDFDISRPMGMAAATSRCKICNKEAVRVFCAPMLSFAPRALVAAIDRTVKSRDEPEVVSALPPRPVRARNSTATFNPTWRRLPRP
jgi:hypothetical protein